MGRRHLHQDVRGEDSPRLAACDYLEVYASTLQINACAVEKALQVLKQSLPLGCRLWRCPDKGPKFDKEIDGHLHN